MVFTPSKTAYQLQGRLCGLICSECREPLSPGVVRLYRSQQAQNVAALAVADPKDTFAILTDEMVQSKAQALLAEAIPDADGNFTVELGPEQDYQGEAFEVDFVCGTVPHGKPLPKPPRPLQFSITTLQPQWRQGRSQLPQDGTGGDRALLVSAWEYCIPFRYWCAVRARFGAWTICGRIVDCQTQRPVPRVRVLAFDTDILQDDPLGSAVTNSNGQFRIDYTLADFQKTPLSPLVNFEIFSGPDLHFRVETLSGAVLLEEPRLRGRQSDRNNVGNCFCVDLCIPRLPVDLESELTHPQGCVNGRSDLLAGYTLEPITGTAAGIGFDRYELELSYAGTVVADGILYADSAGNPDLTPPFGTTPVTSGTLGFVDLLRAAQTAAAGLGSSTSFQVSLRVIGIDGSVETQSKTFQVPAAKAYIRYVGGGWVHNPSAIDTPLRVVDSAVAATATVGGSISVRGAADAYGCSGQKIAEYHLWMIPGFSVSQPPNGAAVSPAADWLEILPPVVYTDPDPAVYSARIANNRLVGDLSYLTNNAWSTREETIYFDSIPLGAIAVPDLVETTWNSLVKPSGQYTLLLQVIDNTGYTYYDVQRLWLDNEALRGKITALRYQGGATDLSACSDIQINNGAGVARKLDVRGYATDPLIIPGNLDQPTSDNFGQYSVTLRRQGAAGEVTVLQSTTPMPARAVWSGGVGEPPVALLATLDLSWLDASTPAPVDAAGTVVPADQRLARGASCTYNIILRANDTTKVNESTNHHIPGGLYLFPVKIVNDLP